MYYALRCVNESTSLPMQENPQLHTKMQIYKGKKRLHKEIGFISKLILIKF